MNLTACDRIMEAIEGATIVCGRMDEGEGLCLNLQDGRCLVIAGVFALSLMRLDKESLH